MSVKNLETIVKPVVAVGEEGDSLRRVRIVRDSDPQNPRTEWDNLFTIWTGGNRYVAGDRNAVDPRVRNGGSPTEAKFAKGVAAFPVYAYVHGGTAISLDPFNDPWDSGCAGFIYVEKAKWCREMGVKRFNWMRARQQAAAEVRVYNDFINGDVFGYVEEVRETADAEWEDTEGVHSCWGYYLSEGGDFSDMLGDTFANEDGVAIVAEADVWVKGDEVKLARRATASANAA